MRAALTTTSGGGNMWPATPTSSQTSKTTHPNPSTTRSGSSCMPGMPVVCMLSARKVGVIKGCGGREDSSRRLYGKGCACVPRCYAQPKYASFSSTSCRCLPFRASQHIAVAAVFHVGKVQIWPPAVTRRTCLIRQTTTVSQPTDMLLRVASLPLSNIPLPFSFAHHHFPPPPPTDDLVSCITPTHLHNQRCCSPLLPTRWSLLSLSQPQAMLYSLVRRPLPT